MPRPAAAGTPPGDWPPVSPLPSAGGVYVDPDRGSDTAAGTEAAPLATVAAALAATRARSSKAKAAANATIVLRGGV